MVAIDTNILIWGLQKQAHPADMQRMIPLAEQLFQHASVAKVPLVIPAQSLAEFLVRNTDEEREAAWEAIGTNFLLASFDPAAAIVGAKLQSDRQHCEAVRKTFGVTRNCFKADINVLASAIQFGATLLVSGNWKEMRA